TASVFAHIFESDKRKEISGIVGTSDVGHQAVEAGWRKALLLLALVSLSLGLINLLPILPLDGGHIFWAIVEKLRGAPVSLLARERARITGVARAALLLFSGLSNDIGRITREGFNGRGAAGDARSPHKPVVFKIPTPLLARKATIRLMRGTAKAIPE